MAQFDEPGLTPFITSLPPHRLSMSNNVCTNGKRNFSGRVPSPPPSMTTVINDYFRAHDLREHLIEAARLQSDDYAVIIGGHWLNI